jgi:hypothetical protein
MPIANLDIDGGTDIGANIADSDLLIIDDGAGGTNRKTAASRLKTYVGAGAGAFDIGNLDIDGGTDIGADIADSDLFIIDDGAGGTNRKTAASRLKSYIGGGGLVLVGGSEGTSDVSEVNIDDCFTSTYKQYIVRAIIAPDANSDIIMRYRTGGSSGSTRTNSDHVWLSHSIYKGNSSQGTSEAAAYNDDKFKISYDMLSDNDSGLTVSNIHFYDPNSQQFSRQYWNALSFWQYNSSNRFYGGHFHGMNGSNVDATGLNFSPSTGNIYYHSIKVYGMVNS